MPRNKLSNPPDAKEQLPAHTARNVLFVLLGVAGLVLEGRYRGPASGLVHSYGGNVAASFAAYFWAKLVTVAFVVRFLANGAHREQVAARSYLPGVLAAGLGLLVVQLFEVFDGFGLMSNVYDRLDLAANTVGIAIAFAVDAVVERRRHREPRYEQRRQ